jgi:hypothetical protein
MRKFRSQVRALSLDIQGNLVAGAWEDVDVPTVSKLTAKLAGNIEQRRLLTLGYATEVRTIDLKTGAAV